MFMHDTPVSYHDYASLWQWVIMFMHVDVVSLSKQEVGI